MVITILPEELEPDFQMPWKAGLVRHPSIDYADNAIYGTFEGKEVVIFRFSKYGWFNDNRRNRYEISSGSAGIMIKID